MRLNAVDFDTLMAPACKFKPFAFEPLSQPSWAKSEASEKWVETTVLAANELDVESVVETILTPEMLQTKVIHAQKAIKPKVKPSGLEAQETKPKVPPKSEVEKVSPQPEPEEESFGPKPSPKQKLPRSESQQDKEYKRKNKQLKRKPTVSQKALQSKMSRTFEAVSKVESHQEEIELPKPNFGTWGKKDPPQSVFNFWKQVEETNEEKPRSESKGDISFLFLC